MMLQGVIRQKPYLGVCYVNDPKKGGYTTPAPVLDLTTSLRGDFVENGTAPTDTFEGRQERQQGLGPMTAVASGGGEPTDGE